MEKIKNLEQNLNLHQDVDASVLNKLLNLNSEPSEFDFTIQSDIKDVKSPKDASNNNLGSPVNTNTQSMTLTNSF